MSYETHLLKKTLLMPIVIITALGYAVDLYDLFLFVLNRPAIFKDIMLYETEAFKSQALSDILVYQAWGVFLGGLCWGMLADKIGRVKTLYISIFLYSILTLLNSFVVSLNQLIILRFLISFALAGELGIGVTLVSENLNSNQRGYGAAIISAGGFFGIILCSLVSQWVYWRYSFFIGGLLGLILVISRIKIYDSIFYQEIQKQQRNLGNLIAIITNKTLITTIVLFMLLGFPAWLLAGFYIPRSPELITNFISDSAIWITPSYLTISYYAGGMIGDVVCAIMSHKYQNRKKIIGITLVLSFVSTFIFTYTKGFESQIGFLLFYFIMGLFTGYWALFTLYASEHFGVNIRATATTLTSNLVRLSVWPMVNFIFNPYYSTGLQNVFLILTMVAFGVSFLGLFFLKETYGKNMNFTTN